MTTLRVGLAQINTTVGDLTGNRTTAETAIDQAIKLGADIVAFPELTITGYPPEDLVLRPALITQNKRELELLASHTKNITAIVGFVDSNNRGDIYNAAGIITDGEIIDVYHKIHLPNYGVFDEQRYFKRGDSCLVIDIAGTKVGVNICEDNWATLGPTEVLSVLGKAEIIININGSPYDVTKQAAREQLLNEKSNNNGVYIVYVNQVGGQDELVFDGASMVVGPDGKTVAMAPSFKESIFTVDLDTEVVKRLRSSNSVQLSDKVSNNPFSTIRKRILKVNKTGGPKRVTPNPQINKPTKLEAIYNALVTGTRDYIRKTGFEKVAIAMSGGIDSTFVATVAVDAVGSNNVTGVSMPSRYSSTGSISDAKEVAKRLKIPLWELPIESAHNGFEKMLTPILAKGEIGIAEENTQSRIRGTAMMAIANKYNWLILTTGNKSEMATGYATIYGDMAGAFSVIKDVTKTLLYELCEYRNSSGFDQPIPDEVITKPPSAELRPEQLDQDSLPPYEQLDRILSLYVEHLKSSDDIVDLEQNMGSEGADEATVRRITHLIDVNEYKRRQSPPGVKITPLAFGRDRRLPIASRFHG